jgi:GR25 family glycosyltransferase involved in LPS biosynthesis
MKTTTIDLTKTETYFINTKDQVSRKDKIELMLNKNNFTKIKSFEGFSSKIHALGCATSHQQLLEQKFNEEKFSPFLILEDDSEFSDFYKNSNIDITSLEIPEDSDCIYLGLTKIIFSGGNAGEKSIVTKKINQDYSQIYNMVAAHAILYTNKDYVGFLSKALKAAIEFQTHQDIIRAETMKLFKVYARNNPLFIQSDPKTKHLTNFSLNQVRTELPNKQNLAISCKCQ